MAGRNRDVRVVIPVRYFVWRFFTGQPLDGHRRTTGTFLYRGNRPLSGIVKASNWSYRPGYQRLLIRLAWVSGIMGTPVGLVVWPFATKVVISGLVLSGIAYGGYRVVNWAIHFQHYRRWVKPLHLALCGQVGIRRDMNPLKWIDIPLDFQRNPEMEIRLDFPAEFNGSDGQSVKALTGTVQAKLALPDAEVYLRLASDTPHAIVKRAPAPPDKVMYSDPKVAEHVQGVKENEVFLGYGPRGKPVTVELDTESPHTLVSARTRMGKSSMTRFLMAQRLGKGDEVVICDIKRVSHKWARGLPRVKYARDIADIHEALCDLSELSTERYRLIDIADANNETVDVGPRIHVLLEELNATIHQLEKYWRKIRTNNDPKASPAVEAIGDLVFMGAAAKIHVYVVAQLATARTIGGPEARENFATRILAGYTQNAWRMLVPEIWPMPKSAKTAGRVQVAIAGVAIETQIGYITDEEAHQLALQGGGESLSSLATRPIKTVEQYAAVIENRQTLQQAINEGWIPMKYDALKRARLRDPEFPIGVTGMDGFNRYTREELEGWFRNRQAGKRGTSA